MDATSGAGTAHPSGAPEFTPVSSGVRDTRSLALFYPVLQKQNWISVIMVIVNVNFTNIAKIVHYFHGNS
jgi:hypothetical protein